MKNFTKLLLALMIAFAAVSCKDDPPQPPVDTVDYQKGILVVNQGQFQAGNAGIDFYDPATDLRTANIFTARNSRPLGDIAQSITIHNNNAYIVVNNSGKIEVADAKNFNSVATISDLVSPRFMAVVSPNKAYVTDLFSGAITIIDPVSNTKKGSIALKGWTEELLVYSGQVYVTAPNSRYVYLISAATDAIIDSIDVGFSPNSIVQDKNNSIWVLTSGNDTLGISPSIVKINPSTKIVESSTTVPGFYPNSLRINAEGDNLYWISGDVYNMDIAAQQAPSTPMVQANGRSLYGLGVDSRTGDVYIGDAVDFQQPGKAYRYSANAVLLDSFVTGTAPAGFYSNY